MTEKKIVQKLFTKNFTLLIMGQASSLFGNFILKFALAMYILEVTGSATIFGSILAVAMIPTILLSPFGGILADRANRRNIMVLLDTLSGIIVLAAFCIPSEQTTIPVIAAMLIALSILSAFETPTVQACVPQMQSGDNIIKANAIIAQIQAVSGLITPILGSFFYTIFGLRAVMAVTIVCFFLTALAECFIKLPYTPSTKKEHIVHIVKNDFKVSMRFIFKEQPAIFKLLSLGAIVGFFLMGICVVGLPYTIRNILELSAEYYGLAESLTGVAAIAGSIAVGLLLTKFKMRKMYLVLITTGFALLPAGLIFLLPVGAIADYAVLVASVCILQFLVIIFSTFILSAIQQKTPNELLGKIMACAITISMCAYPLGQIIFGMLFDRFHHQIYLVLIPSAIILVIIGILSKKTFRNLETH